jgi:RNA polymerase sigma-70 factor (ECF subfamily)
LKGQSLYEKLSDKELLDQFQQFHDKHCLGILLQRYTLLLLGVCLKYLKNEEEAKDAVQQVFTKVIIEIEKYPVEHFKSWIYTIARNYCFMQLRNKIIPLPEEAIDHSNGTHFSENPDSDIISLLEKEELLDLLNEALNELQPNQQQCVTLFYMYKKSYRQICQQTGFNILQVKSFIQNGKRNIRLLIEKKRKGNAS